VSISTDPAAAGKVFNVSDGQFHTMNEIVSAMRKSWWCQVLTFDIILNRDTSHFHYEQINFGGTAASVKSPGEADAKRLVFFSTIAVYPGSQFRVQG